jgi:cobalamin biosynthesis Co2+ chelatase CbiK
MDAQISSSEYDEISEIILSYNLTEYDNRKMSSDVQELINDYYKLMNNNKYRHASLEEQKVFVLLKSGISIQQINEMSYRIFSQVYTTALDCDLYISNKIIQGSQKYETKGEIVHPLLEKKVDILEKIFTDKDKFVNDMKSKLG